MPNVEKGLEELIKGARDGTELRGEMENLKSNKPPEACTSNKNQLPSPLSFFPLGFLKVFNGAAVEGKRPYIYTDRGDQSWKGDIVRTGRQAGPLGRQRPLLCATPPEYIVRIAGLPLEASDSS